MNLKSLFKTFITIFILFLILKLLISIAPFLIITAVCYYLYKKKPREKQTLVRQCGYCKKSAEKAALVCDFCGKEL